MFKKIFLTGDYHAEVQSFEWFRNFEFPKYNLEPKDVAIIQLGDFGMNMVKGCGHPKVEAYFEGEKQKLEDSGFTFFVIRGNHDQRPSNLFNSEEWRFETMFDGPTYVEKKYPHIHYAMDYPWVYNIDGYKTLVLPGAHSVDKARRLWEEQIGGIKTWFEDEAMTNSEMDYALSLVRQNNATFDLILSHTCPWSFIPRFSINQGPHLDADMERLFERILYEVEENGKYGGWVWAHHHTNALYEKPDGGYNMVLYGLHVPLDDYIENKGQVENLVIFH